jgi:hypothetical protein
VLEALAGKPQGGTNVLYIKGRQCFHYLLGCESARKQVQDITHTNAQTTDAGTTSALLRVYRDPIGKIDH